MKELWLAALSGSLYALAYPGFGCWPLGWVAFVPLLYALDRFALSWARALAAGLCFGTVAQLVGCYWLFATLRDFAQLQWPLAIAAGLALCLYQGAAFAVFAGLCRAIKGRGLALPAWFAPCALGAVEAFYPALFPSYTGAALQPLALLQLVDVGGPVLASMLLMTGNAALFGALRAARTLADPAARRRGVARPLLGLAALLIVVAAYGTARMAQTQSRVAHAPRLRVGIVQANMPPLLQLDDRSEGRRRYIEQSQRFAPPVDLLVWPETALHYALAPDIKRVRQLLGPLATPVLFGGLARAPSGEGLYNSAYLADAEGLVLGRADKQHLIPFAEYVPWTRLLPALERSLPHSGQFVRGTAVHSLPFRRFRIATSICYEDLLPGFVRTAVQQADPHLLVNLSNDVWFGRSTESDIHQALARLRAIEHRRFLVRANNSGISSIIDPSGRFVAQSEPFTARNLVADVALLDGETWYGRTGPASGWLALALVLLALARGRAAHRSAS